jgi:hypothetical protein
MNAAHIKIRCKIRFIKGNINTLNSILDAKPRAEFTLKYDFDLKDKPTFFDLWSRCPTMMLALAGQSKPFLDFDVPLIDMKSFIFDAYDWTEEYTPQRYMLKSRMCAKIREELEETRSQVLKELERIRNRINSLVAYEAALVNIDFVEDPRFPL